MIKIILSAILSFTLISLPCFAQEENGVNINERLNLYFPVLEPPHCVKYLTDFGSTKKNVEGYVQSTEARYFATMSVPNVEGVTAIIYADPENMISPDGYTLTNHIIYSFIFDENNKYFAFAFNVEFNSPELADSFQKTILDNLKVRRYTRDYSSVIKCKETGKQRMVISRVKGSILTYVIMDYQTIIDLSIDTSRM